MPIHTHKFVLGLLTIGILVGQAALAADRTTAPWIVKTLEAHTCVAQNAQHRGMLLENKKLTIPLKEMSDLEAYKITINDKVVTPVNKPNLVDTSCNCIRIRDMDILKNEEVTVQIDGVTNRGPDISVKMVIKGIPYAMQELQTDACRRPQKNLSALSLSMRQ